MPHFFGGSAIPMLSATVRSGKRDSSWNTLTIPARLAAAGVGSTMGLPASSIVPASGFTTPATTLISVDLPAPFSPRTAWMRPRAHSRRASATARTPPYRFEMPSKRSSGVMLLGAFRLLIGLRFAHDLFSGEADLARGKRVPDEEVVGESRIEVRALLDVRVLDVRRGQRDRLRDLFALERGDRRLDRHRDLGRARPCRGAMQPLRRVLGAQLAEAVLGLAGDRDHRMPRVEEGAHGTGRAALHIDAGEILVDGDRVGGRLLRRAVIPLADHLDHLELLARFVQDLVKPVVPIAIDRVPRGPADLEELAAVGFDLLEQPLRRETAELDLVHVDDDVVI